MNLDLKIECTGIGLACPRPSWLSGTRSTWPKPKKSQSRPERLGRDDEADGLPGRDPRRSGRDNRDYRNVADDRLIPGKLGRRPTPITVNAKKLRSVKLIHY